MNMGLNTIIILVVSRSCTTMGLNLVVQYPHINMLQSTLPLIAQTTSIYICMENGSYNCIPCLQRKVQLP